MHHKNRWPVAYICMPLGFILIGILIAFAGLQPVGKQLEGDLIMLFHSGEGYYIGQVEKTLEDETTTVVKEPTTLEDPEEDILLTRDEPNIGEQYGTIACDRIGLKAPIYFGDNDVVLDWGAGTFPGSWIPGCGGTTLIAGHNGTYFHVLKDVEVGDAFTIATEYGDYEYIVSDFTVVNETEIEACRLDSDEEQVVLYTCYPFYRISGRRTQRFFVYLEKVSGPRIELEHYFLKD